MCPLKGESANCLSAFQSVIYESLTSDSPAKVNSSVNQSYPLISVSVNQRVDCISAKSETEFSITILLMLLSPYSLYQLHFLEQRYRLDFKGKKISIALFRLYCIQRAKIRQIKVQKTYIHYNSVQCQIKINITEIITVSSG